MQQRLAAGYREVSHAQIGQPVDSEESLFPVYKYFWLLLPYIAE